MQHPSDFLHSLLHCMTPAELKHFRVHSITGKDEPKYYRQLMDTVLKMQEYDEEKLIARLGKEKWSKRIAFTKHYLHQTLLEDLSIYHRNDTTMMMLREMLNKIDLLYLKGLHIQCLQYIAKAKKVAYKYEDFQCIMVLLNKELLLLRAKFYPGKNTFSHLSRIKEEMEEAVVLYQNMMQYAIIEGEIITHGLSEGMMRKKRSITEQRKMLRHPLLSRASEAKSIRASYFFNICKIILHNRLAEDEHTYKYIQLHMKLIEKTKHIIAEDSYLYINSLRYSSLCLYYMKRYREALDFLNKMKPNMVSFKKQNHYLAADIEGLVIVMELSVYCRTGEFEKATKLIEGTRKKHGIFPINIIDKECELLMHYYAFYSYFGTENFKTAHRYISNIINAPAEKWGSLRKDVISTSRIAWILLHYEMGNNKLIPQLVHSADRFFQKRNAMDKFETTMIYFLSLGAIYINSKKISFKKLNILLKKMRQIIQSEPFGRRATGLFDYITWIECKFNNRKFAEMVKEKS